jgi:hypothetical protein
LGPPPFPFPPGFSEDFSASFLSLFAFSLCQFSSSVVSSNLPNAMVCDLRILNLFASIMRSRNQPIISCTNLPVEL